MCRMQCALALVTLSVGLVHSWDYALTLGNRFEFYTNNSKTHDITNVQFKKLTALTYDAVHNTLIFVDEKSDNVHIIFSYNLYTDKLESLVTRNYIKDIAYDQVKELLFWTEDRSIYWISIKPGYKNSVYGNLISMDDGIPMAIAVDSCRGYVYWTNINTTKPTIERARFDGSEREVLIDSDIHKPISLAIDQRTRKMFWIDASDVLNLNSADLNGKNVKHIDSECIMGPKAPLTISKDEVIWTFHCSDGAVYLFKILLQNSKISFATALDKTRGIPSGIAANYKIEEQTQGIAECEALTSLLPHNSVTCNDSLNIPADSAMFCVHGIKVKGESLCECAAGYTGERCDVSVCHNYCFQGDCNVSAEGLPECRCSTGYSGERCEISACFNYCNGNGVCFLNERNEPVCQCNGNYEGSRCGSIKDTSITTPTYNAEEKNLSLLDLVSKNHLIKNTYIIVEVKSP